MNYASTFARMRQMAGNPVLTYVKARTAWTSVPTGYTFDASYDAYINSGGTIWKPTSSASLNAADYATVAILPGAGSLEKALTAGGLVDQGDRFGRILPGSPALVNQPASGQRFFQTASARQNRNGGIVGCVQAGAACGLPDRSAAVDVGVVTGVKGVAGRNTCPGCACLDVGQDGPTGHCPQLRVLLLKARHG